MLRTPDNGQITSATDRIVALDRARTFITLLVVLYHAVINYTHFGIGGDRMRWLGFDLVVLFCDSFFMACMFFISGLFVHDSLARRGASNYLIHRAFRVGLPFLISIFMLMPIAYYRYYHLEFDFPHYYAHMVTTGPWSAGSAWFLWVLLVFDAIAAAIFAVAPRAIAALGLAVDGVRDKPLTAFAALVLFSIAIYLPLRVSIGESHWSALGHYPIFIQTSRAPLYAGYFLAGVGVGAAGLRKGVLDEGGAIAQRWRGWLAIALAGYAAILLLVYIHRGGMIDLRSPPLWWHAAYGVAFALFGAAMTVTVPAFFLHFAKQPFRFLDAMQKQAYGIYLLHFIPLIWLQYLVTDPPLPALVKFAIVFAGTLSTSWIATLWLRKISIVARMI
ncbi:MAG TPA: acyltransferase [Bradyrhizobium sp.]|jgi:peptidoglycan/LPS O-acetylase OafA/YrhL